MSALLAPVAPEAEGLGLVSLRPVEAMTGGTRQLPLLVAVSLLFVLGLGGLLALNIHIQDLSFDYREQQRVITSLSNQESDLRATINTERSTATLAQRASLLGMVPYPYPAVINLADGTITGELRPAVYGELPNQTWNGQISVPELPVPYVFPSPRSSAEPTPPTEPVPPVDVETEEGTDTTPVEESEANETEPTETEAGE